MSINLNLRYGIDGRGQGVWGYCIQRPRKVVVDTMILFISHAYSLHSLKNYNTPAVQVQDAGFVKHLILPEHLAKQESIPNSIANNAVHFCSVRP